jgi:hypothetical protein
MNIEREAAEDLLDYMLSYYGDIFPDPVPGVPDSTYETYSTATYCGWEMVAFEYSIWTDSGVDYLGLGKELYAAFK